MLRSGVAVRRSDTRGTTQLEWLRSRHSFSFGEYRDPQHAGFGPLRVLNDDVVAPGAGFGPHAHRDMEIVSYVLRGALEHRDSSGHQGVLRAGEVQFLRAGTGVVHSEMNHSATEEVHFLQIWFLPRTQALKPHYEQQAVQFPAKGGFLPLVSGQGLGGLEVDADASLFAAKVAPGAKAGHVVHGGRQCYLFVAEGEAQVGGEALAAGDAALVRDGVVGVRGGGQVAHVLLFDLPA